MPLVILNTGGGNEGGHISLVDDLFYQYNGRPLVGKKSRHAQACNLATGIAS